MRFLSLGEAAMQVKERLATERLKETLRPVGVHLSGDARAVWHLLVSHPRASGTWCSTLVFTGVKTRVTTCDGPSCCGRGCQR